MSLYRIVRFLNAQNDDIHIGRLLKKLLNSIFPGELKLRICMEMKRQILIGANNAYLMCQFTSNSKSSKLSYFDISCFIRSSQISDADPRGRKMGIFFPKNKVFNTKNNVKDDLYDKCKKCFPISSPKSSCWIHAWSSWCISEIYVFVLMLFAF